MSKRGIIKYRREGRNKYDYSKKLWLFKCNDSFLDSKKKRIKIEYDLLNRRLDKLNDFKRKKLGLESDKREIDKFVLYELVCCSKSDLSIENLDEVIEKRIDNKLNELKDRISWLWLSSRKRNKELEKISDLENWKRKYRIELKSKYEIIIDDLKNLKMVII